MVGKVVLSSISFLVGMAVHHYFVEHTSFFINSRILDSSDGEDEEDEEAFQYEPHKMILVVRMDLKMGKGMF